MCLVLTCNREISNTCLRRLWEDWLRTCLWSGRNSVSDGGYHDFIKSPFLSPYLHAQKDAENIINPGTRDVTQRQIGKGCKSIKQRDKSGTDRDCLLNVPTQHRRLRALNGMCHQCPARRTPLPRPLLVDYEFQVGFTVLLNLYFVTGQALAEMVESESESYGSHPGNKGMLG